MTTTETRAANLRRLHALLFYGIDTPMEDWLKVTPAVRETWIKFAVQVEEWNEAHPPINVEIKAAVIGQ